MIMGNAMGNDTIENVEILFVLSAKPLRSLHPLRFFGNVGRKKMGLPLIKQ